MQRAEQHRQTDVMPVTGIGHYYYKARDEVWLSVVPGGRDKLCLHASRRDSDARSYGAISSCRCCGPMP